MQYIIVGCGLTGAVIARALAEAGNLVQIWERREQIGGNMYDYVDGHGFLVQKYGPHIFHTSRKELYEYMCRFEQWKGQKLICGAVWDGKYTPTPFNFTTIDMFYSGDQAKILKQKLREAFSGRDMVPVMEILHHEDADIRGYGEFLFHNDYAPYTAKQWNLKPEEIDPSVLARVPVRLSYDEGYFTDTYQVMPVHSFTAFFRSLLDHPGIQMSLGVEALHHLSVVGDQLLLNGCPCEIPVIYTGALDELFQCEYGRLPYRSLRFEWKFTEEESYQPAPVVAYPQEPGYTRITEYKKLPLQNGEGSSYAVEYPIAYEPEKGAEPYYPVLTEESKALYEKYYQRARRIKNLIFCGRLGDFKYYNMDQALARALEVANGILTRK